jgi:hypothetical protein
MNQELFIKMVLEAWHQYLKRTDEFFQKLSDDDLKKQIAPGKNTGLYLLGHLTAVHDRMLPLLGLGDQLYPGLTEDFERKPDGEHILKYDTKQLRESWAKVNAALNKGMTELKPSQWFERHTAVSAEDFKKEPHRNKLNVIINRTNHVAWHYGQILLLKPATH